LWPILISSDTQRGKHLTLQGNRLGMRQRGFVASPESDLCVASGYGQWQRRDAINGIVAACIDVEGKDDPPPILAKIALGLGFLLAAVGLRLAAISNPGPWPGLPGVRSWGSP
jgi:hypothetical protein